MMMAWWQQIRLATRRFRNSRIMQSKCPCALVTAAHSLGTPAVQGNQRSAILEPHAPKTALSPLGIEDGNTTKGPMRNAAAQNKPGAPKLMGLPREGFGRSIISHGKQFRRTAWSLPTPADCFHIGESYYETAIVVQLRSVRECRRSVANVAWYQVCEERPPRYRKCASARAVVGYLASSSTLTAKPITISQVASEETSKCLPLTQLGFQANIQAS